MELDLIDVFANGALSGNPLAVVRGGDALDAAQMLALTRWLGFSETTFLLPPTDPAADYALRIFYPAGELPFAGHPTLGSAAAWLAAGGVARGPMLVQQCGAGLIDVRANGEILAFRAPPLRRSGALDDDERAEAIRVAGVDPADVIAAVHADNGPGWRLLHLTCAQAVLGAQPVSRAPVPTDVGLVGAWPAGHDCQFEVRAFFTDAQGRLAEDPVTGSLNASVAQYLLATGAAAAPGYRAGQGQCSGADGQIRVTIDDDTIWIGGRARIVSRGGTLTLDDLMR